MFPSINPQQRRKLPYDRILVLHSKPFISNIPMQRISKQHISKATHRISLNRNRPGHIILHQPRPPTPLHARQRHIELDLQFLQPAKRLFDLLPQRPTRGLSSPLILRRQVLPEQAMVEVPAAVEVDERQEGDLRGDVGFRLRGGELLGGVVEGGHVGLVVLAVMEFHDFAGDGRFERAVVIWGEGC